MRIQPTLTAMTRLGLLAETVMASDDFEGTVLFNHEESVIVLFADGHVEELDLEDERLAGAKAFGKGGLLDPLAD